ncbi:MAG: Ig-like domain-containing protein [bacterium]|nr:Ig-like domain-containing protein [bacterium]
MFFYLTGLACPAGSITLTEMIPRPGQNNVALTVALKAYFSEALRPESVHIFSSFLRAKDRRIPGMLSYKAAEKCINFIPHHPLQPGTEYTFTLTNELTSRNGNPIKGVTSWQFRTAAEKSPKALEPEPNNKQFGLLSSSPADGAVMSAPPKRIVLKFNRKLLPDSLTLFTVRLSDGHDNIMGDIQPGAEGQEVVFVPDQPLVPDVNYTMAVGPGVFTRDGDYLDVETRIQFSISKETAAVPVPEKKPAAIEKTMTVPQAPPESRLPVRSGIERRVFRQAVSESKTGSELEIRSDHVVNAEQRERLRRIRSLIKQINSEEKETTGE